MTPMTPKYELVTTDATQRGNSTFNSIHYRIRALKNFGPIKVGDLGGYIEKESNLSHEGNCWVAVNAHVFDDACVCGNAQIYDRAWVSGRAYVADNAHIYGDARISGDAHITEDTYVSGTTQVTDNAHVYGGARVIGDVCVYGAAKIFSNANVSEKAFITGNVYISGNARVYGNARISADAHITGTARISGDTHVCATAFLPCGQWTSGVITFSVTDILKALQETPGIIPPLLGTKADEFAKYVMTRGPTVQP